MPSNPPLSAPHDDEIARLVRAGRHDEAATLCEERGDLVGALALYEKLWAFDKAWPLAERLGNWPAAVRLALDAKAVHEARRMAARVPPDEPAVLLRVSDAFAGRGQFEIAAQVAERAGDFTRAADLYRRAGMSVAAATALLAAGKLRDAARLLQNVIATNTSDGPASGQERAQAQLIMGKLLGRLGRPWEAARALQNAAKHASTCAEASRYVCGVLLELGLPHAAAEVARRLQLVDPASPTNPRELAATLPVDEREVPERFVVQRLLGTGGTGRVFLAVDRLFDRQVALKALSVGATASEEQALVGFVREAEAAGRLKHHNIVALYDVDISAGVMAFEYVEGGSLADVLSDGQALPFAKVRRLALELLDALSAAHDAGIIHRDVKPANVFLDAAGNAKLGDFGAAHLLDFGQTQTGGLIGTLAYLSPEQVTGGRIGAQADLYGLAATLFEALTGRPPFLGPDFVSQHLAEPPPTPSALLPDLDPSTGQAVDSVLLRALAKTPEDRYANARAMLQDVQAWPVQAAIAAHPGAALAARPGATPVPSNLSAPSRVLGENHAGVLLQQHDIRTNRDVIVWRPHTVLNGQQIQAWRALAAKGGPQVQRVLGLANADGIVGAEVTFELVAPCQATAEVIDPAFAARKPELVALAKEALEPEAVSILFVHTVSGPVWLVQPSLRAETDTSFTPGV